MRCSAWDWSRLALLAGAASATLGASSALAVPTTYSLLTTIAVPASPDNNVGGKFATYDISFFDPTTQLDYVADRSNAAVDIFSAMTNSYVGRIGGTGQLFAGQKGSDNTISGPDGVQVINLPGQHIVYAGDGDSTLKGFNIAAGNTQIPGSPLSLGNPATDRRVDEMSFDPQHNRLLAANNAADVPFVTLINTTNNSIITKIAFDGTNNTPNAIAGGIEASDYNPNNGRFYLSIPQIGTSGPGGVSEIDSVTGQVLQTFDLASFGFSSCSPAGIVHGLGNQIMIACGNASQSILFDPTANGGKGAVIASFTQASGSDQVWYDPKSQQYFLAARSDPSGPILGIVDAVTATFVQAIPTTPADHSVSVDPISGEIFMPFGGVAGNNVCPNGCIAVFAPNAASVPEPGSFALLAGGMIGLAGLARRWRAQLG